MGHHHNHLRASSPRERTALQRAIWITAVLLVAEVTGGLLANSLALLSDAGHMLTDLVALGLAGAAIGLASRPSSGKRTFGYYRLEILSAQANGILLVLLACGILLEAVERFGEVPVVRLQILAPIAFAGLVANALSFWWLSRAQGGLSTRAALWHTVADGASSVLVLASAGVMSLTSWWWMDPLVSVLLAGVMVFGAFRLLRESLDVLLESSPASIDLEAVQDAILGVAGVEEVHDLHVWSLTSSVHALSGHVQVSAERLSETDRIIDESRAILESRFAITHTTLQVESEGCGEVVCVFQMDEPSSVRNR